MTNPGMLQTPKLEILANGSDSSADSYDDDDEADNKTIYEVNIFERNEIDNEGKPVYKDIKVLWLPTMQSFVARHNTGAQNIEAIFQLTREATEKIKHVS